MQSRQCSAEVKCPMKEVVIFRANEALNAETKDSTNQNFLEPDASNSR
jgi:hypothetical protein